MWEIQKHSEENNKTNYYKNWVPIKINIEKLRLAIEQETQDFEQSIIKKIETKIPREYNIQLCINKKTWNYSFKKYMLVENEKWETEWKDVYLNSEIWPWDLQDICNILIQLFNEDIWLKWEKLSRIILNKEWWIPEFLEEKIISFSDTKKGLTPEELRNKKNEIEELFVFVSKIKKIDINDWNIQSSVCALNKKTTACKEELWNNKIVGFYEPITKK